MVWPVATDSMQSMFALLSEEYMYMKVHVFSRLDILQSLTGPSVAQLGIFFSADRHFSLFHLVNLID